MRVSILIFVLLTMTLMILTQQQTACKICLQCIDCPSDVMTDPNIDEIHSLLTQNIQQLGTPLRIRRESNNTAINYQFYYSSGLVIRLRLHLSNMQIQLLTYDLSSRQTTQQQNTTTWVQYQTTADGYSIIANYQNDARVKELTNFLAQVVKTNLNQFKLTGVQFKQDPVLLYRLKYQLIAFDLIQLVYIQYMGPNSYRLIDSNYSAPSAPISLKTINSLAIMDDLWLHKINNIIVSTYSNLLGTHPSILTIAQQPPYYRIIYQNGQKSYQFFVQYDYLQDRILSGNITMQSQMTQVTQTQNSQPTISQNSSTTTTSQTSNGATLTTTTRNTSTSSQNSQSSSTSSSQSGGSLTTDSISRSTNYTSLANLQQSTQITSLISYLITLQISLKLSNILQAQTKQQGPFIYYRITYRIDPLPSLTSKDLYYQFVITQSLQSKQFALNNSTYLSLNPPSFVALSMEAVTQDVYIRDIAQYLLQQNYTMLGADSRVVRIERDFPYYQFGFNDGSNELIKVLVVYNYFSNQIKVISISKESSSSQTTTSTQTTQGGQTTQQTTTNQQSSQFSSTSGLVRIPQVNNSQNSIDHSQSAQSSQSSSSSQSNNNLTPATKVTTQTTQATQANQNTQSGFQTLTPAQQVPSQQQPTTPSSSSSSSSGSSTSSTSSTSGTSFSSSQQLSSSSQGSLFSSPKLIDFTGYTQVTNLNSSTHSQYLPYISEGMSLIGNIFTQQGISTSDIRFVEVWYRLGSDSSIVIYFSTVIQGGQYFFQYRGKITTVAQSQSTQSTQNTRPSQTVTTQATTNSNSQQTQQAQNSQSQNNQQAQNSQNNLQTVIREPQQTAQTTTIQTQPSTQTTQSQQTSQQTQQSSQSLTTSSSSSNQQIMTYQGTQYNRVSQTIAGQAYVSLYLKYLETTNSNYLTSRLAGIYTNPLVPYSLLFVFFSQQQYFYILTNPTQIQRKLSDYYKIQREQGQQQSSVSSSSSSHQTGQSNQQTTISSTTFNQATRIDGQTIGSQTSQTSQTSQSSGSSSSTPSRTTDTRSTITTVRPSTSSSTSATINIDKNCLCYEQNTCLKCAHRYFLRNNQCIAIPAECGSYDLSTGVCYSCNPGYQLNLGLCQPQILSVFYSNNQCYTCFPGYKMVNNQCVWSAAQSTDIRNQNRFCFSWRGSTCVECYPGTYLSSRNICQMIDPFCLSFDYSRQVCSSCQNGYNWTNGRCYPRQ